MDRSRAVPARIGHTSEDVDDRADIGPVEEDARWRR
jgi:hypothetical protein